MIKYGSDDVQELKFNKIEWVVENRAPWVDIYMQFEVATETPLPDDISDLGALVICNVFGDVARFVVLDAGCDSEYEFTDAEKGQIDLHLKRLQFQKRSS